MDANTKRLAGCPFALLVVVTALVVVVAVVLVVVGGATTHRDVPSGTEDHSKCYIQRRRNNIAYPHIVYVSVSVSIYLCIFISLYICSSVCVALDKL